MIFTDSHPLQIVLSLIVARAPFCIMAPPSLRELERTRELFRAAKEALPHTVQMTVSMSVLSSLIILTAMRWLKPMLELMVDKSWEKYAKQQNGTDECLPEKFPGELGSPHDQQGTSGADCMSPVSETTPNPFKRAHPCLSQVIDRIKEEAVNFPESTYPAAYRRRNGKSVHESSAETGSHDAAGTNTLDDNDAVSKTVPNAPNFEFGALNSSWNDQSWMTWF